MKKKISNSLALLIVIQIFFSCNSVKPNHSIKSASNQTKHLLNVCEQRIKYKISSVKNPKTLEVKDLSMEIIINPETKLMTVNSFHPTKGLMKEDKKMEVLDCSLYDGLKEGYAVYQTTAVGPTNETEEMKWSFEMKEGGVNITYTSKREIANFIVDSWEIVN